MNDSKNIKNLPPKYKLFDKRIYWFLVDIKSQNYIKLNDAINSLTIDENHRRESFKNKILSSSFAIRRALLRLLIASEIGSETNQICINYNKFGKPYIKQNQVYFNLSHTADYAVYAFSYIHDLGVDIERIKYMRDECSTANTVMTSEEYSLYQSLVSDKATLFFFKCWTSKEAYLKLLGVGFQIEPREVILQIDQLEPFGARVDGYPSANITFLPLDHKFSCIASIATYD